MATSTSGVYLASETFDQLAQIVIEDLRTYYGDEFNAKYVSCVCERTNHAELSLQLMYKGQPALQQTLDLLTETHMTQVKRWCQLH